MDIKKKPRFNPKVKSVKIIAKAAGASKDALAASLFARKNEALKIKREYDSEERPESYASNKITQSSNDAVLNTTKTARKHVLNVRNRQNDVIFRTRKNQRRKINLRAAKRAARKTAKVSVRTAKTAAKVATHAAKAAQKAAVQAAKAAKAVAKVAMKTVIAAGKAIVAIGKAIIAFISSVGWPAVVILIVAAAIGAILTSPYGIVIDDEDESTPQIKEIVSIVESEFEKQIADIIAQVNPDETVVEYADSVVGKEGDNWADVLAVYAVKTTTTDRLDVLVLDDIKQDKLRAVFWDMNVIQQRIEIEKGTTTVTDENGNEREVSYTRTILYITINVKDRQEMFKEYAFDNEQTGLCEELLASYEFGVLVKTLVDQARDPNISDTDIQRIRSNLQPDENVSDVIEFAISKLGMPYSRMDCSKFVQLCFEHVGVSLPRTAAEQAKYCLNNNFVITKDELMPGDLIFFSHRSKETGEYNDRFMSVSHVGVYVGNGMMIDSSASNGKVVLRDIIGGQVLYGQLLSRL